MTDEELAAASSEIRTGSGQTSEHELEAARAMDEALERLKHDRDSLPESYAVMIRETLEDLTPEERHRI